MQPTMITNASTFGKPKTTGNTTAAATNDNIPAMIKQIGGLKNWLKIFPMKAGDWTQVLPVQIKAVEGSMMPKAAKNKVWTASTPLRIGGGWSALDNYEGPRTGAAYIRVTVTSKVGGIKLFAWYVRDADLAKLRKQIDWKGDASFGLAQSLTSNKSPEAASGKVEAASSFIGTGAGFTIPTQPDKPKGGSVGARDVQAEAAAKAKKKPIYLAWYEVTEQVLKRLEGSTLPSNPVNPPLKLSAASNVIVSYYSGPRHPKAFIAKIETSGGTRAIPTFSTRWFVLAPSTAQNAGKVVPLPKGTPVTPTTLPPSSGNLDPVGTTLPTIFPLPATIEPMMPVVTDSELPDGFEDPMITTGGGEQLLELGGDEAILDKPLWKNPLVWAAVAATLVGGVWIMKRKAR
jgi:hypothetical protein